MHLVFFIGEYLITAQASFKKSGNPPRENHNRDSTVLLVFEMLKNIDFH